MYLYTILSRGDVSCLDHAGYLGKELYKAEAGNTVRPEF